MNAHSQLADRTRQMHTNVLREILKTASQPGIDSLAGGIPAKESFSLDIMAELADAVWRKYGAAALQYGPTEGFAPLKENICRMLAPKEIQADPGDILITSGSQGALDALAKIMVSKGDKIALESPTYLGALQAFSSYEPEYLELETDADGPTPDGLRRLLETHYVKFIYLVPTFQNPTGGTIPVHRRNAIAEVVRDTNALLVEDDPYSALRYQGENLPAVKTMAPDNVVYLGTFSKILAPGLRVGFCLAPEKVRQWLVIAKQGTDLHTGSFSQALAAEYLSSGYLAEHLPRICALYASRHRTMMEALETFFPDDWTWSKPEGGMFVWAKGPFGLDMDDLYSEALQEKVAFVPGTYFHVRKGDGRETMRLNFTMCDEPTIWRAVQTLGRAIERHMDSCPCHHHAPPSDQTLQVNEQ